MTSQQLRESLENLRAYAAQVNEALPGHHKTTFSAEQASPPRRTPLDFATMMLQRVHKARIEAQALRRRAADLRDQAATFRAHSENLRSNSVRI